MAKISRVMFSARLSPEYRKLIREVADKSNSSESQVIEYALGYAFGFQGEHEVPAGEPLGGRQWSHRDRAMAKAAMVMAKADEAADRFLGRTNGVMMLDTHAFKDIERIKEEE